VYVSSTPAPGNEALNEDDAALEATTGYSE
jgi:hypothetical protein